MHSQNTAGIKFIEFQTINIVKRMPSYEPDKRRIISQYPFRNLDEVVNWIIGILKAEEIHDEFLLMWDDRERDYPSDWVKVSLSSDYEWVKPLWERARELYFMPLDKHCLWEIYGMVNIMLPVSN